MKSNIIFLFKTFRGTYIEISHKLFIFMMAFPSF